MGRAALILHRARTTRAPISSPTTGEWFTTGIVIANIHLSGEEAPLGPLSLVLKGQRT